MLWSIAYIKHYVFDIWHICWFCIVFVLCHLLAERQSREDLRNHATILMLLAAFIYQLIEIPLHLHFLSTGVVHSATPAVCLVWWYIDWCFFFLIAILLVFVSFQQYILIFHSHSFDTNTIFRYQRFYCLWYCSTV